MDEYEMNRTASYLSAQTWQCGRGPPHGYASPNQANEASTKVNFGCKKFVIIVIDG